MRQLKHFYSAVFCCMALFLMLVSCSTNEPRQVMRPPINLLDTTLYGVHPQVFLSIAQAEETLDNLQDLEGADLSEYVSGRFQPLTNYHRSLLVFDNLHVAIQEEDENRIHNILMFNMRYIDQQITLEGDTLCEPLSLYDYRCLVNEKKLFIINDTVYRLFGDTIFVGCPRSQYPLYVAIMDDPLSFRPIVDSLMSTTTFRTADSLTHLTVNNIYTLEPSTTFPMYTGEGLDEVRRFLGGSDSMVYRIEIMVKTKYYGQNLGSRYQIKGYKYWNGRWWNIRDDYRVDLAYDAEFFCDNNEDIVINTDNSFYMQNRFCIRKNGDNYHYPANKVHMSNIRLQRNYTRNTNVIFNYSR